MQRCRDSPAPGNEGIASLPVHRHDRGTAEKPAQLNSVTGLLSGCRQKTDGSGFVIHHADGSLIRNDGGNGLCRGVPGEVGEISEPRLDGVQPGKGNAGGNHRQVIGL